VVVVSEQIVQSAVTYHVGYKVPHPALEAHNDCTLLGIQYTRGLTNVASFWQAINHMKSVSTNGSKHPNA